ncbi:hypothetical protein J2W30_003206 [Variovorax boronicumulans]|nr:hypothetical protein [Variovorax boronicumulans]
MYLIFDAIRKVFANNLLLIASFEAIEEAAHFASSM